MAARRKKTRSRRKNVFRVLGALEAAIYANILTTNLAGANLAEFVLGNMASGNGSYKLSGGGASIAELVARPELLQTLIMKNAGEKGMNIVIQSFLTGIFFRVGRRLMRKQLGTIQRQLVKPILGPGISVS